MQDYVLDAIILDVLPARRELDGRFFLLTKQYGKIAAAGTSTRKITSKLNGHLQPGYVSAIRLVERHGLRIVDSLKKALFPRRPQNFIY
ncbi:MAG: hypothetical protein V1489_02025 [Candidatus Liptonbacteria bacterium]